MSATHEMEIPTSREHVTTQWLTKVLRQNGVLPSGNVISMEIRDNEAVNSKVFHLSLNYSSNAQASASTRLLVKLNWDHHGREEVGFYNLMKPHAQCLPMLVTAYAAAYDSNTGNSFCLLEDISQSHMRPVEFGAVFNLNGVPSDVYLGPIIDAIAEFHAYWWEHPSLGQDIFGRHAWFADEFHYQRHIERRHKNWMQFIAAESDSLPAEFRAIYQRVLEKLPILWERFLAERMRTLKNITLVNGDCYFSQFLCPRIDGGRTYMVDLGSIGAAPGANDLVYLLATFWTSVQRHEHQREEKLLRRYLEVLHARGINDYSWEELMTDYKVMLTLMIFDPVWNQTDGSGRNYWWPKMSCLIGTFQDLRCMELLE